MDLDLIVILNRHPELTIEEALNKLEMERADRRRKERPSEAIANPIAA